MKKAKYVFIIISVIILVSCYKKNMNDDYNKYKCSDIPSGGYRLYQNETVIFPFNNRIYTSGSNINIGYYDLNLAYNEISEHFASAIFVDEYGIVIYNDGVISTIDNDGIEHCWDLPFDPEEYNYNHRLARNENTIMLSVASQEEDSTETKILFCEVNSISGDVVIYHPEPKLGLYTIQNISPIQGGDFSVIGLCTNFTQEIEQVALRYEVKKTKLTLEYSMLPHELCDISGEIVYGLDFVRTSCFQLISTSDSGTDTKAIKTVGIDQHEELLMKTSGQDYVPIHFDQLFYTGSDLILWDANSGIMSVYDVNLVNQDVLTILYPVNDANQDPDANKPHVGKVEYAIERFEARENCRVESEMYPISEFHDRLRMKLLSGDSDFDIVYLDQCTKGDLLAAILRYKLYFPLENSPEIMQNMKTYADGVMDFMTDDNHLFGCPIQFGGQGYLLSESWLRSGLPIPEYNWSLEDFWMLCEEAKSYCVNETALVPQPQGWILGMEIQNAIRCGTCDIEAVRHIMTNLLKYHQEGVILNYGEAEKWLMQDASIPPQSWYYFEYDTENSAIVPIPSVDGYRYAPLESFVMINPKTKKSDIALKFIIMLTGEDFAPLIEDRKTYAMKDHTSYFEVIFGNGWTPGIPTYQWIKQKAVLKGSNTFFASKINDVFPGTSVQTYDLSDARSIIKDITDKLFSNGFTVDEATDAFCQYINYRYFE